MSYYDNKKNKISPRKQAEKITKGETKEHHIGKKSNATLQQLFFSLVNDNNRTEEWIKKYNSLIKQIPSDLLASLKNKYQSFAIPK